MFFRLFRTRYCIQYVSASDNKRIRWFINSYCSFVYTVKGYLMILVRCNVFELTYVWPFSPHVFLANVTIAWWKF
jgi:hypothetical protein